MNYTQTLEFLFSSLPVFEAKGATAYKPGLERITAFCRHICLLYTSDAADE